MPSVVTALAPTLFSAAQEVSAEPFGFLDSINLGFSDKGVALGDSVTVPVAPVQANSPFAAANVAPEGTSITAAAIAVTITKSQQNSMVLTGEQIRSLENGTNYQEWVRQWAAQAMRALRNEAEADAGLAVKYGASRAAGVAGTTPFVGSLDDLVAVRKILRDNGSPMSDLQLVIDTAAASNLFKLGIIQQAAQAGSDEERRQGRVLRQFGFAIRESAGVGLHVKGTGTAYQINNGNVAVGSTLLTAGTGSNTMVAGDVLALQSDTANKYVCNTGLTAPGTFTIGRPGLRVATVNAKTITIGNGYTANMAFERNAVVGVMRPPVMPANPTIQQIPISDGKGLTYLMLDIAQFGQRTWMMCLAWGYKVVQSEHVAVLMG